MKVHSSVRSPKALAAIAVAGAFVVLGAALGPDGPTQVAQAAETPNVVYDGASPDLVPDPVARLRLAPPASRTTTRVAVVAPAAKKAAPRPAVKEAVVQQKKKVVQKPKALPPAARGSAWVEAVRRCIVARESHGNYRAQNRYSSASGAYQFIDSTWRAVTGLPGSAKDYSSAIQDAAFYKLFAGGKGRSNWSYPPKQCW